MTSQIFIENQTDIPFNVFDSDKNLYGQVFPGNSNSLKLRYNVNFNKQYKLVSQYGIMSFTLSRNGKLHHAENSSRIANLRISTIKTNTLPIENVKNDGGGVLMVTKMTQKVYTPNDNLLIIFPPNLSNPSQPRI